MIHSLKNSVKSLIRGSKRILTVLYLIVLALEYILESRLYFGYLLQLNY
jgi:hypothetical protein